MNREDGTISIEKVGTSYRAYFEYDKDFISWVKKDGHGSWNSAGRYWSLTAKGVLNLLDQHNDKWFNVADELQKPRLRLSRPRQSTAARRSRMHSAAKQITGLRRLSRDWQELSQSRGMILNLLLIRTRLRLLTIS